MVIREALAQGSADLKFAGIESPGLDAQILLAFVLKTNRTSLIANGSDKLSEEACAAYTALIERRCYGECTAYIIGKKEFRGLEFTVNKSVLVPRPETETLVEAAIEQLKIWNEELGQGKTLDSERGHPLRLLDLCTGSGAVAIALKNELPELEVFASDICADALETAKAGESIEIFIDVPHSATEFILTLTDEEVAALADSGVILFVTSRLGSLVIDPDVISAINAIAANDDSGTVDIIIRIVDPSELNEAQRAAVGDDDVVYDVSIRSGDTYIHELKGSIRIDLLYVLKPGQDAVGVYVHHITEEGAIEKIRSSYDDKTGMARFTVTHLSIFAVGYDATIKPNPQTANNVSDVMPILVPILCLLAVCIIIKSRRKWAEN